MADLGQQLAVAVRQVMAEAAAYLALVIRSSPGGSADVLLARPETVTLEPLMRTLLLSRVTATEKLWQHAHWPTITLREVI